MADQRDDERFLCVESRFMSLTKVDRRYSKGTEVWCPWETGRSFSSGRTTELAEDLAVLDLSTTSPID